MLFGNSLRVKRHIFAYTSFHLLQRRVVDTFEGENAFPLK